VIPAKVSRKMAAKYDGANTVTAYKEFAAGARVGGRA
jgi:hypothetical protein